MTTKVLSARVSPEVYDRVQELPRHARALTVQRAIAAKLLEDASKADLAERLGKLVEEVAELRKDAARMAAVQTNMDDPARLARGLRRLLEATEVEGDA